jgi:hypothetical protein
MAGACKVEFADRSTKPLFLEIRASIFSPTARFSHDRVFFAEAVRGVAATRIVTVINEDYDRAVWRITGVQTSSPLISVEYRPGSREIVCRLSDKAPVGLIAEKIVIAVQLPSGPSQIEIPVNGEVVEEIRAIPSRLFLGSVATGQSQRCQVTIPAAASRWVGLPEAAEGIRVCRDPGSPSLFIVEIVAPQKEGFFAGELKFTTHLDSQPFVKVRDSGMARAD